MGDKKYTGFLVRLVAVIIDGVILGVAGSMLGRDRAGLFSSLIGALYSILLWVNCNGQTLGKKVMKIKVVKEDGSKLQYTDAIVRYLGYIVSTIVVFLGFVWVAFDEKKQGWHDKIAKTLVVQE